MIFVIYGLIPGILSGLVITTLLGFMAYAIMEIVNRHIYAGPLFGIMFAVVLLLLMLVVHYYPYEDGSPADTVRLVNNLFMQAFGYSASVGIAALLAALAMLLCPVFLCPKKEIEIMPVRMPVRPKSNFINSISQIFIICSSLGMLFAVADLFNYNSFRTSESLSIFLISLILFILSIGLLRRQNWARFSIQTLLLIVIILNLIMFIFEFLQMKIDFHTLTGIVHFISTITMSSTALITILFLPLLVLFMLNSKK